MGRFSRREKPPAEVVALLAPDDRVLAWADVEGGGVVVATRLGLWWPAAEGARLIGWQFVDKAVWRDGVLTVIEAEVVDDLLLADRPPVTARLSTPRDLPPTLRKRVEANIVRSELLAIGGGAVRFVARRTPGHDGLSWLARLESGAVDSPDARAAISARLAILRAEWADSQP